MQRKEKNSKNINHAPVIREAVFRFYEELNEHLPKTIRRKEFIHEFKGTPSVKNVIESIGVPHSEIDLILVDGSSVDFTYQMRGGEHVSVYPVFESLDISSVNRLRAQPLRVIKFIVDVNLGKLANKLRLLGFDTLFRNDFEDAEIIEIAANEKRIILTRDRALLTSKLVTHAYWIRNHDPKKQLSEVVQRLQLTSHFRPFSRCSVCNSLLRQAEFDEIKDKLPQDTLQYYDVFWECEGCEKLYWKGSHYKHIENLIEELRKK